VVEVTSFIHRIDWVKVLRPTQHKIGHFGDVPQANLLAWYVKTKPNTMKAPIKRNVLQHEINTKTKARFSRLLWHPAWNWRGPILALVLHKFVTYLDTYQLIYSPGSHKGLYPQKHPWERDGHTTHKITYVYFKDDSSQAHGTLLHLMHDFCQCVARKITLSHYYF